MGSLLNLKCRLLVAIQNNDVEGAEVLLAQGVDADVRFNVGCQLRPAVCLCAERGNVEMMKLLLQWGCSINQCDSSGNTPLHIAVTYSHKILVDLLLQNRANVKAVNKICGSTPLHFAAKQSDISIVKMLVAAESNIDKQDQDGRTPLALACIQGEIEIVNYLVQKGSDVNKEDSMGNTPLLHAVSCSYSTANLISVLLKGGAKINHRNRLGEISLLIAIKSSEHCPYSGQKVDLLLENGCDINVTTCLGHSPLHLAISQQHDYIIEKLIRCGCNPSVRDSLGLTPLFYLAKQGKEKLAFLLVDSGILMKHEKWIKNPSLCNNICNKDLRDWLIKKYAEVPSLKNLCRATLRAHLGRRADNIICDLPLPPRLISFLCFFV